MMNELELRRDFQWNKALDLGEPKRPDPDSQHCMLWS